ncbi:MAG TPA: hypothetical protein VLH83_00255 [Chthoniobacterales bacterium]|nr:hypothetical protein [Chthoniobacterales bacterium]
MIDPDLSPETVRRIQVELSKLDAAIQGMSLIMSAKVTLYHHHPVRMLEVRDREMLKTIQVSAFLQDPAKGDTMENVAFGLWIIASKDVRNEYRFGSDKVAVFKEIPDDFTEQVDLLQKCWDKLQKVTEKELMPLKSTGGV